MGGLDVTNVCGGVWIPPPTGKNVACPLKNPFNPMPASSWIAHVKAGKGKGMSYKDALRAAAKTWKKKSGAAAKKSTAAPAQEASDEAPAPAPKKRRRKRARPGPGPDEKNIN